MKGEQSSTLRIATPCTAYKPDEIIEDHYKWFTSETTNLNLKRAFGAVATLSLGVFAITF